MSERQAVNLPLQRAKPTRKRKPGEGGEETVPVAEAAADAGQDSPAVARVGESPDGRGLQTVEGLIGAIGVGVAGVVATGLRGGSGGGEIASTGDVVATRPVSPPVTGVLIPERPEPAVTPPVTPTTKTPDPVETVVTQGPGTQGPGIVEPKIEPKVEPAVEPKIEPEVEPKIVPPIEVDTTPPGRPSLALKRDTGTDPTDGVTSDPTITVSDLEAGATWRYSLDDGETWHAGRGSEISDVRFDGDHEAQVVQTDTAGNSSEAAALKFTLDTGAPTLRLKNDTGRSRWDDRTQTQVIEEGLDRDGITKDGTLVVTGLKEKAVWQFSLDEGGSWRAGEGNEIPAREMGADGRQTVWVRQQGADMDSGLSSFSFVLDTRVSPVVPWLKFSEGMMGRYLVTREPVIVFDGFEEGSVVTWTAYGGAPELVAQRSASPEIRLSPVSGKFTPHDFKQLDLAGNFSTTHGAELFFFVPPEAGLASSLVASPNTVLP